jgi:multicomponent Na+:H+ antiporter subunit A
MAAAAGAARMGPVAWVATMLPLALFVLFATQAPTIAAGGDVRVAWDWVPSLDIRLAFRIDGLSLLFALLISGIGTFVFLYAGAYLAGHPRIVRFYLYLSAFMLAMLGVVLADDLIALFVFWELTSLTSYLLIGFNSDDPKARRSALQALLVTGAGGLAMLAGFILMGIAGGTYSVSALLAADVLRDHALYAPILALVLLGAFTKSAQVPFHFWLPNAMAAPTPVSAYLHSATMVKAGIYLMARLHPGLGGTDAWAWTLTVVGAVTAVWASIVALRQTDMKLMLAYTTVMALGTLTMFLGDQSTIAIAAAVTFILVHSLYKATLFMVIGAVDHETGTRQLGALGGLARVMPMTAAAAALAAFSMAGFPPFLGFIGKELKYEGALAVASEPALVAAAAVAANAMMVTVALVIVIRTFFGRRRATPKAPHEAPWAMLVGPMTLAAAGLIFGTAPELVGPSLVQPGAAAIGDFRGDTFYLALWHGINLPLALSILTVTLGLILFWQFRRVTAAVNALCRPLPSGDRLYDRTMDGLVWLAAVQTRVLQGGSMRTYLAICAVTLAAGVGGTLIARGGLAIDPRWPDPVWYMWGVAALIVAATAVAVFTHSRLAAICALGVVGSGVALVFVVYGAPDVAMTQLMVEILVVVIVAIVLLRLPAFHGVAHASRAGRVRDGVVAVACGGVVTALLLAVTAAPLDRRLTDYFEAESVPGGFGRNIVNVILVDFRALDTFGEIAVVAVAGLACFALIRTRRRRRAPAPTPTGSAP